MKECFKCHAVKPLSEYYRHEMMADGHLNKCKECTKHDACRTRAKRLSYYQEYDRQRSKLPHRKAYRRRIYKSGNRSPVPSEVTLERRRRYRTRYPEKYKARNAVANALRDGILKKKPCVRCGNKKTHGHHEDYSKPLDVVWLCTHHHGERHRELNEEKRKAV